jgi:hypothetical protein
MNTTTLLASTSPTTPNGMIAIVPLLLLVATISLIWWTVRTKRYLQTLFGIVALAGGICSIIGFNKLDLQTEGYLGAILIGLGLFVVLGVLVSAKILYFRTCKNASE